MVRQSTYNSLLQTDIAKDVTLCVVTRNDEGSLKQCLTSVRGIADEIVVADLGSTDRTLRIAEDEGATIYRHHWRENWAEVRNAALLYTRSKWILQMEPDETLEVRDAGLLRRQLKLCKSSGLTVAVLRPGVGSELSRQKSLRLFHRNRARYFGLAAETPRVIRRQYSIALRIHGRNASLTSPERDEKDRWLKALILSQMEVEPENPALWAQLVGLYRSRGELDVMMREAENALVLRSLPIRERLLITNDLIHGLLATHALDRAEELAQVGLEDNPYHMDMLYVLGEIMSRTKRYPQAIDYYAEYLRTRGLSKEQPGLDDLIFYTYGYKGRAWNAIGTCYRNMGKAIHATDAFRYAVQIDETNVLFRENLEAMHDAGKIPTQSV